MILFVVLLMTLVTLMCMQYLYTPMYAINNMKLIRLEFCSCLPVSEGGEVENGILQDIQNYDICTISAIGGLG